MIEHQAQPAMGGPNLSCMLPAACAEEEARHALQRAAQQAAEIDGAKHRVARAEAAAAEAASRADSLDAELAAAR